MTLAYCGQTVAWIKLKIGMEVGLSPGHTVLDEDTAPPPPNGSYSPRFSAHVCCGQTAGWIKIPLGEVGLVPGDIVLDWDPAFPKKGAQHPQFWPMYCGQMAERIKMPLGTEIGVDQGYIVLHGDPAHPKRGHSSPQFSARVCCGRTAG